MKVATALRLSEPQMSSDAELSTKRPLSGGRLCTEYLLVPVSPGERRGIADLHHLPDAPALIEELADFRANISDAGYTSFCAREGAHDDLVLSVALALWWATRGVHSAAWHAVHI